MGVTLAGQVPSGGRSTFFSAVVTSSAHAGIGGFLCGTVLQGYCTFLHFSTVLLTVRCLLSADRSGNLPGRRLPYSSVQLCCTVQ